ncbi:MAG: class I SAM-dependent methyltransferase family protein, partial [Candidatus Bathyarchaeia archaeon]
SGMIDLGERISLKVAKEKGEAAISILKRLNVIDKDLRVASTRQDVFAPLCRALSEDELALLESELRDFKVTSHEFKRRDRKPRSLVEAIGEQLEPHILAELPRSYDIVGNTAILELPESLLKHGRTVGEAMMRVNPHVKTVLGKASPVTGKYRTREFILLAGHPSTVTEHREHGFVFRLDVRTVYFSPRLSRERQRIAAAVQPGETVVDMFAGVGPFSIVVAGSRNVRKVYGIDINPDAVTFMLQNIMLNKLRGRVTAVLADAATASNLLSGLADRVVMNLPADSERFIPQACRLLSGGGGIIHFYTFISEESSQEYVLENLRKSVEGTGKEIVRIEAVRAVRPVAPREWQLAVDVRVA